MKAYIYAARTAMETMMAYRFQVWTYTIMQCLMMIAVGFFWRAAYGGAEISNGVTDETMITYTVISNIVSTLYYMGVEDRVTDAEKSGSIATDLIKPVNLFGLYFAQDMGCILYNLVFGAVPLFIVSLLVFGLPAPASGAHLCLFLVSFALGYGINWTFSAVFSLIAFTAIDLGPVFSIKYHFVNMLSGAVIPLWFFPEWLQRALYFLPFVYMYQEPLSMYIGKYDLSECLLKLGVQAIWLAALTGVFMFAQKRAERRVLVQGG